jgi:hypothetical protein
VADIQLFCNVDDEGTITDAYMGKNIVATESYDFFFLIDEETAENITEFRVVIERFKPRLERTEPE